MGKSISVVMPALNEEANLEAAVDSAIGMVSASFDEWEILIFNDGSTDNTGAIAERLACANSRLKVFHHETPRNLGGVYREGVNKARYEFLIMLPGDNENGSETVHRILSKAGQADVIVPYVLNTHVRAPMRRWLSKGFVGLVNLLSGCRLRYYNGTVLHKTSILKKLPFRTNGFGYQAEILIQLIRKGYSYQEVGVELAEREKSRSSALKLRNFIQVTRFMLSLLRRPRKAITSH